MPVDEVRHHLRLDRRHIVLKLPLRLTEQQRVEQAALSVAEAEVDSLRTLVEALESDPATIEMVAREHFGMIREGETLYRFVEAPVDATPLDIAASTAVP